MEREWICRVADKPRTASRTREREATGEKNLNLIARGGKDRLQVHRDQQRNRRDL